MRKSFIKIVFMFIVLLNIFPQSNDSWDSSGTGFVISPNGLILTAAHVVEESSIIKVILNGKSWDASILSIDKYHDIALLSIEAVDLPVLALANSNNVLLGEDIRVVGFPLSNVIGTSLKITKGSISGIMPIETKKYFQIDASINPGNSGGPLINNKGEVIGIISSKINSTYADSNGFAVPINYSLPLLKNEYYDISKVSINNKEIDGVKIANISKQTVVYILTKNIKKENDNNVLESIKTKEIIFYGKDGIPYGSISTDSNSNPYISLHSKDFNSKILIGFEDNKKPYIYIEDEEKKNVQIAYSDLGNPGIWVSNEEGTNIITMAITKNGSIIDMKDPITKNSQIRFVGSNTEGNKISIGDSSNYWRIVLNSSNKGTYIGTYDINGKFLWGSF